jgi:diguanylate cyclase (GGDEF)-like protein
MSAVAVDDAAMGGDGTQVDPHAPVEAQLRTMLDTVAATIALFDREGQLVAFNRLAQQRALGFYGRPLEIGRSFPNPVFQVDLRRALAGETVEVRRGPESREPDVQPYWVDMRIVPVVDAEGAVVGACYHSVDITAAVLREREEERAAGFRRALLELTRDLLAPEAADDLHERVLDLALRHVSGAATGRVLVKGADGAYRLAAVRGDQRATAAALPAALVEARLSAATAVLPHRPDDLFGVPEPAGAESASGSTLSVPVRVSGALAAFLVLDASGERVGFPARAVEDGELLAAQLGALLQRLALEDALRAERERLDYLAHHDPLTDLPNRALLGERLALTLARDRREGALTALFVIDLDGFKALNDRFGHAAGDELLVAVGHGLRGAVRAGDTVARWGGDEFAIVAGAVADRAAVRTVADHLHAALTKVLSGQPHGVDVRASTGVAVADDATLSPEALLHRADLAMYRAKRDGGGRLAFYDEAGPSA